MGCSSDTARGLFFYGPGGIRTLDLSDANRTLSQLSYRPIYSDDLFILCLCPQIVKGFRAKSCFTAVQPAKNYFCFPLRYKNKGFSVFSPCPCNKSCNTVYYANTGGITMRLFDVLGPVMTGPSSSHTAGAVRIGSTARRLPAMPTSHGFST